MKPVNWKPNSRPQEEFMKSSVDELLYGGAAGGGKSEVLMIEGLRYKDNPRAHAIYFRRTFPELEMSIIPRSKEIFQPLGAKYNAAKHHWVFPSGFVYRFGYMDNDDTAYKYQSSEFTYVAFDELTHFTQFQYEYLKSRARTRDAGINVEIRSASNPGGVGHNWVKEYFLPHEDPYKIRHYTREYDVAHETHYYVEHKTPVYNSRGIRESMSRQFIPAKVYDNPAIMDNNPEYVAKLKSLPPDERRMLLEGDWEVFKGQFFKQFSPLIHGVRPFVLRHDKWKFFGGLDYGESAPTSFGLYAVRDYPFKIIKVGSYYKAGLTASEHARNIVNYCRSNKWTEGHMPETIYADPSMFTKRKNDIATAYSPADVFIAHDLNLTRANNERVPGWQICKDILNPNLAKEPTFSYFIGENEDFVRTITGLVHDNNNPEDLDTSGEDHEADNWRYCMTAVVSDAPEKRPSKTWRDMLRERIAKRGMGGEGSFMGA